MPSSKSDVLREEGTLNPRPEAVRDPKFEEGEFFDPRDLVQVKYELLRSVQVEGASVTDAVATFGFSRPTFYQAKADFERAGIAGLVPKKRGPRGPHKLTDEILDFLNQRVAPDGPLRARELAVLVHERFGVKVHPRTIERAFRRSKKKPD